MSNYRNKYSKRNAPKNFKIWFKAASLMVLGTIAVFAAIYSNKIYDRDETVAVVKSFKPETNGGEKAACPGCRGKFYYSEFTTSKVPNMRGCPQCGKNVPQGYLLNKCFGGI